MHYKNTLGDLTDDEIAMLSRPTFKDRLYKEKSNIYRKVVYNRLKSNERDFIQFFSESKMPEALRLEDNTLLFQKKMLSRGSLGAVSCLPQLYPEIIIHMLGTHFTPEKKIMGVMARNIYPETNNEILSKVFKKNPRLITSNSLQILGISEENYISAVTSSSDVIRYVPKRKRTDKILDAVITTGKSLANLEVKERTPARCLKAVTFASSALAYVPTEHKTQELCNLAVSKGFSALGSVPKDMQTAALKMKALLKHKNAKKYIKKG
jgi:hypothetical protein